MMALQEAELSLRFLNQVRAKAVAAYQEIMRMQF
jgi:flagellar hook-basal body complex protein FliE